MKCHNVEHVEDMHFDGIVYWLQVQGLVWDLFAMVNSQKINNAMERLIEVDPHKSDDGCRKVFLRIKFLTLTFLC